MVFESPKKNIAASQERVYGMLSNLKNLERVKVDSLRFDDDNIYLTVPMLGDVEIHVAQRTPSERIVLNSTKSKIGFSINIDIKPVTADSCQLSISVDANVNPFMGAMVAKPLKEGLEKVTEVLTQVEY